MNNGDSRPWRRELIRASQSDGQVDFAAARQAYQNGVGEEPILDADLFRILYTGHAAPGEPASTAASPRCMRWRIKGATFNARLDLSDSCHASCGTLPSLEFEGCSFPEGFCADDTLIMRLSFTDCSFGLFRGFFGHDVSISLHNAHLEGDFEISGLKSLRKDNRLSLFAMGLHVMGSVRVRETLLKAPADERQRGEERAHYALELYGAEIRNDLHLFPRVIVHGGVRIRAAHIGGDTIFADLHVSDGQDAAQRKRIAQSGLSERQAIDATSCQIAGNVFFQSFPDLSHFNSSGPVTFFGFETKGSIVLSAAQFSAPDSEFALSFSNGKIEGHLLSKTLSSAARQLKLSVNGHMEMYGLSVKGTVYLVGYAQSIDAGRLEVQGDTTLAIQVDASLNLGGASLKGQLDLSGFSFSRSRLQRPTNFSLTMKDADVGHTLYLANSSSTTPLEFESCRRTRLRCYPGYHLFEIRVDQGVASILAKPGKKPVLLDGVSDYLHRLSRSGALDLSTSDSIKDYIRFFGAYVWASEGPFVLVESLSQIPDGSLSAEAKGQLGSIGEIELDTNFSLQEWHGIRALLRETLKRELTAPEWSTYQDHFSKHAVKALAHVRYGANLFPTTFVVLKSAFTADRNEPFSFGWIRILNEGQAIPLDPAKFPVYERPLIRERLSNQSDYISDLPSHALSRTELSLRIPEWLSLLENRLARFQNAEIDLTNASCRTLEDADGRAWGSDISSLRLENFTYARVGSSSEKLETPSRAGRLLLRIYRNSDRIPDFLLSPLFSRFWVSGESRESIEDRLTWLGRMPRRDVFLPQPYTQLASVLSASGDTDGAKTIEERKIFLEVRDRYRHHLGKGLLSLPVRGTYRLLWALFRLSFRYGLSPARASATVFFCLLFGWAGVAAMNAHGYLVQSTSTTATWLAKDANHGFTAAFPTASGHYETAELPCGTSINGLLYAADVFIPLLDLRQEARCDVRSLHAGDVDPDREWTAQKNAWRRLTHYLWAVFHARVLWAQFAKSAYAVLGWVVISLTILTYSGMLRKWES